MDAAYSFCERALQIDHRNALALSLVSFKYIDPVIGAQSANPQADIRQADELATQALATDPDMSLPHFVKAFILMAQNRAEEPIVEAERSLEMNPSYISAYDALA